MTPAGYALLGLTAIVGMLAAVVMFAVLRFASAARASHRQGVEGRPNQSLLLASALEEAITKLKAQERATAARAEASERLSSEIVASLSSGLILVDGEGIARIVNPAAQRILQLPDESGVPYERLLHDVEALREVVAESLKTRQPILRRTVTLDRSGGPMHLGVSVSPIAADRGPGGAICLFSDLTAVVQLEEQLRLKEALARLGELTAGLAHEFRNGLATIHGYAWLMDPASIPAAQQPYIAGIRSETQSLGAIVTNFLNFAKPTPLALAPVNLRSVVERAAEDVLAPARVAVSGEFANVDGDEVLLRQAFSNLFRNSVEACGIDGRRPMIKAIGQIDPATEGVVLTVTDNGPGIPSEALTRVFQPFFTMRQGGTGLGLAIVQKIVVSHNGRISAGNDPNGGASFVLTLPLQQPASHTEL